MEEDQDHENGIGKGNGMATEEHDDETMEEDQDQQNGKGKGNAFDVDDDKVMDEGEGEGEGKGKGKSEDKDDDDYDIITGCYVFDIDIDGISPPSLWIHADYICIYNTLEVYYETHAKLRV